MTRAKPPALSEGSGDSAVDTIAEAAGVLTETQQRRLIARLGGKSLAEIAESERRSKSAVAESLKAPAVRKALTILGRQMVAKDPKTNQEIDLISSLLQELAAIALSAKRPVVLSAGDGVQWIEYVRDNRTRLDAIVRLLGLVEPEPLPRPVREPEVTTEVERTLMATETRRTRTSPVRTGSR